MAATKQTRKKRKGTPRVSLSPHNPNKRTRLANPSNSLDVAIADGPEDAALTSAVTQPNEVEDDLSANEQTKRKHENLEKETAKRVKHKHVTGDAVSIFNWWRSDDGLKQFFPELYRGGTPIGVVNDQNWFQKFNSHAKSITNKFSKCKQDLMNQWKPAKTRKKGDDK